MSLTHARRKRWSTQHFKRLVYALSTLSGFALTVYYTLDMRALYPDSTFAASLSVAGELLMFALLFALVPRYVHVLERCLYPAMVASLALLAWLKVRDLSAQGLLSFEVLALIVQMMVIWFTVYLLGAFLTQSVRYVNRLFWGVWATLLSLALLTAFTVRLSTPRSTVLLTAWLGGLVPLLVVTFVLRSLGRLHQRLATTDNLTGLANRHILSEVLERQHHQAQVYGRPFAVVLVDLDHFKLINDTYGHAAGDTVLSQVAALLLRTLRRTDTIGRWGGDEFLVVLPQTSHQEALELAERVRAALVATTFPAVGPVTATIGVQGYRPGHSIDALLAGADQALYVVKQRGRNAVGDAMR
jgi:diguanylate cyclase (GGDEF)-like protein